VLYGACALLLGFGTLGAARAALPAAYSPITVQPKVEGPRHEFDLRAAQARARAEHKQLYIYLGAVDCRFCARYEAFLKANAAELAPLFARRYVVVDLRSHLSLPQDQLVLRTDKLTLPYKAFQQAIGDERARLLVYPSVWLMDADARPVMQMPAGTGTFETVPEQIEILDQVQ